MLSIQSARRGKETTEWNTSEKKSEKRKESHKKNSQRKAACPVRLFAAWKQEEQKPQRQRRCSELPIRSEFLSTTFLSVSMLNILSRKDQTMNREQFEPYPGRIYTNHGGGRFLCIAGGDDPFSSVMKNIASGWTLEAHNIGIYED